MNYRDRTTGQYPLTRNQITFRYDGGLPRDLGPEEYDLLGVDPVAPVDQPSPGEGQTVREGEPERVDGVWRQSWIVEDAPSPDITTLRASALATAMAYGNAITGGEISQWAGVEPLSWTQQREEALIVRGGGTLEKFAMLPGLAEDKGITLEAYADDVLANAARYQTILRAAVQLRRTASATLSDEALDTPEKLQAAVDALQVAADALAADLIAA